MVDHPPFRQPAEEPTKRYVEFIVGIDETGENIERSAAPYASEYLTPVRFRKQVLDKYYQQTGEYSVEDSILRCGSLWSLYIDNHHNDKVCAWLGDLGRDPPYEDQLHWREHNIAPKGRMSETYVRCQILAQFAEMDHPEHVFKERYGALQSACVKNTSAGRCCGRWMQMMSTTSLASGFPALTSSVSSMNWS